MQMPHLIFTKLKKSKPQTISKPYLNFFPKYHGIYKSLSSPITSVYRFSHPTFIDMAALNTFLVSLSLIQASSFVEGSCDSFSLGECTNIDSAFYENDKVEKQLQVIIENI